MLTRLLSLAVAAALVGGGVVKADEPPRPPEGHPIAVIAAGQSWAAPDGGGLCLDMAAVAYQVERVRYYETRIRVAEDHAEASGWKAMLLGLSVGLAVGASVALVKR